MTFVWPWFLLTLAFVPLLISGYRRLLRQRADRRAALAELGLVAVAPPGTAGKIAAADAAGTGGASNGKGSRSRHLGPALFLGALTLLLVALARPEATVTEPRREGTVVLAFDVSSSMAATDLQPTRMQAAQAAARAFVDKQPAAIRISVVAFGESGVISQQPTTDRTAVVAAIDRLAPQGGTALGRGIQTSLSAIAGRTVQLDEEDQSAEAPGQDLGYFGSAAVILLSDGENTDGPDPLRAAELASTAGVQVYPIGLGRAEGTVLEIDGFQVSTALDEPLLRDIAEATDGEYLTAEDEQALTEVYASIDLAWTVEGRKTEVTALLAGLAALLLLLGAGWSVLRTGRVI